MSFDFWNPSSWWFYFNRPTSGVVFDISTFALNSGQVSYAYSQTLTTVNGTGPYTWSVPGISLPTGISLGASTGILSGVPIAFGSYKLFITVTDTNGLVATRTLDLIIANVRVSGVVEGEFAGKGNGWTIITDVLMKTGISFHRGLPGVRVTDRVADASILRFSLDNSQRSSGGLSYYSTDHVNCRPGWDLNIGIRYRIGSIIRFTGILDDIDVVPGLNGPRTVSCTAVGWFDTAQRQRISDLPVLVNQRGDVVFQTLIDSLTPISHPLAIEKDTSPDILPYTLDRTRDEETILRDEIYRVAMSELSLCWERGDGTIVWEARSRRATTASDIDTFTDSYGFLTSRNRAGIINNAQATVHPRIPGQFIVELYSLNTPTALSPSQTITIEAPWTDPNNPNTRVGSINLEPIVPGVDFIVNATADGLGEDLTHAVLITTGFSGNATTFNITLLGSTPAILLRLAQRGIPLYDYGPSILKSQDDISIQQYGISQPMNIDMPYQANPNLGQEICQYIVYSNSQPKTMISAPFTRFFSMNDTTEILRSINRDISDRIKIQDPVTGLSRSFFVNAIDEIEMETTLKTQWTLDHADSTVYWLLEVVGRGELGINTRPAFGLIIGHTDIAHNDVHIDDLHNDVTHVDTHTDNAHIDQAHGDGSTHGDTAHIDSAATNTPHGDSHSDTAHDDSPHQDVRFTNSHSDIPHSDVAHGDNAHSDVAHIDQDIHSDGRTQNDDHIDEYNHFDTAHTDIPHNDVHNDTAHSDQHNDSSFIDEAHEDIAHSDIAHADTDHGDSLHGDVVHSDSVGHADNVAQSIPHGDVAHVDINHSDIPHGDIHGDNAHADIN